jgi:hypothetical protein
MSHPSANNPPRYLSNQPKTTSWNAENALRIVRGPKPPTTRAQDRKAYARSRITSHFDLLPGVDGNSKPARRFRDLVHSFLVDLGGLERISEIKLSIVRQLAAVTVMSEQIAAKMAMGEKVDINAMCTLASTCMRLSVRLGLERVDAKPAPGLHDPGGLLDQLQHERARNGDIDVDGSD